MTAEPLDTLNVLTAEVLFNEGEKLGVFRVNDPEYEYSALLVTVMDGRVNIAPLTEGEVQTLIDGLTATLLADAAS